MLLSLDGNVTATSIFLRKNQGHRTDFSIFKLAYGISNIYGTKRSGANAQYLDNDPRKLYQMSYLVCPQHKSCHNFEI